MALFNLKKQLKHRQPTGRPVEEKLQGYLLL
jgi:hypothetical protein